MAGFNVNELKRRQTEHVGIIWIPEDDGMALNSMTHPRPVWYMRPYWAFRCWWAARK